MKTENRIFSQVYSYLEQGSRFVDKRHLTVLSWMVTALLSSQSLNQARWEPFRHLQKFVSQSQQGRQAD